MEDIEDLNWTLNKVIKKLSENEKQLKELKERVKKGNKMLNNIMLSIKNGVDRETKIRYDLKILKKSISSIQSYNRTPNQITDKPKHDNNKLNLDKKEILSVQEACEYLQMKKSYLYKLTSGGILPYYRPNGGRIFFKREDLEKWLLSNYYPGKEERDINSATYITLKKDL